MTQNNSELERQEKKLKNIRWYQVFMTFFLILALTFIVLYGITLVRLKAQEKLRGDFHQISLVIKLTRKTETSYGTEEVITQEEAFKLYEGPTLSKDYYGKSLGYYLTTNQTSNLFFHVRDGFLYGITIPSVPLPTDGWWKIYSYSDPNVDSDHSAIVGVNDLLLDRVNIFVFQFNAPLNKSFRVKIKPEEVI